VCSSNEQIWRASRTGSSFSVVMPTRIPFVETKYYYNGMWHDLWSSILEQSQWCQWKYEKSRISLLNSPLIPSGDQTQPPRIVFSKNFRLTETKKYYVKSIIRCCASKHYLLLLPKNRCMRSEISNKKSKLLLRTQYKGEDKCRFGTWPLWKGETNVLSHPWEKDSIKTNHEKPAFTRSPATHISAATPSTMPLRRWASGGGALFEFGFMCLFTWASHDCSVI